MNEIEYDNSCLHLDVVETYVTSYVFKVHQHSQYFIMSEHYSTVWVCHIVFIHSLTDEQFGWFGMLWIMLVFTFVHGSSI